MVSGCRSGKAVRAGSGPATVMVKLNSERIFAENMENFTGFPHLFYILLFCDRLCLEKPRKLPLQ